MRWSTARSVAGRMLAALIFGACVGSACTAERVARETGWERDARVMDELRAAGRYAEALAHARDMLARADDDAGSPAWLREDARRRVAGLEQILTLDAEARAQLARADRLKLSAAAASDSGFTPRSVEQSQKDLTIRERILGPGHFETAAAASRGGGYLRDVGDYVGAQRQLARADSILRLTVGTEHPDFAANLLGFGVLRRLQREPEAAMEFTRPALEIYARTLGPATFTYAQALVVHAGALRETPRRREARALYEQALAIIARTVGKRTPEYAAALHAMGNYQMRVQDFVAAERSLRAALAIRRPLLAPQHPLVAWTLHDLGTALLSQQKLEEASECYRASLRIRELAYGREHPLLIEDLRNLPRLAMTLGRYAQADTFINEAIRGYEIVRQQAGTGLQRDLFFNPPYDQLAVLRLLQGREDEAWAPAELAQSRALSSLLLAGERSEPPAGAVTGAAAEESGDRRASPWVDLVLPGPRPVTVRAVRGGAFDPGQVQAVLREGSALVGWISAPVADERRVIAYAYVVRPQGPVHWVPLPGPAQGPNPVSMAAQVAEGLRAAAAWPARLRADSTVTAELRYAWEHSFRPVEPYLRDVRDLIVIPAYVFPLLPIEALIDSTGNPIGDRWDITYAPSATAYTWLRLSSPDGGPRRLGPALLIGGPPGASVVAGATEQAALPGTRRGLERIAALLPGATTLLGSAAREDSLHALAAAGELERYQVLVFATHARADQEFIERSALILSAGPAGTPGLDPGAPPSSGGATGAMESRASWEDGLLTAGEISADYQFDADLVWLAGCGTGLGRPCSHEAHLGLASAFLLAGARSLVVSLWPMDDEATGLLATRYFQNRTGAADAGAPWVSATTPSKAWALSEAKRWLRARTDERGAPIYEHPVYWAGFILIGDPWP